MGRDREAKTVQRANRAAAVGRLMLGELRSWGEYADAGKDLHELPRRMLKSGLADVRRHLSGEIERFCRTNFRDMTEVKLATLYDEVRPPYGLRIPLEDFEARFARVKPSARQGCPAHATVVLSLWGLQFEFPEDHLSKDLIQQVEWARAAQLVLEQHRTSPHALVAHQRESLGIARRRLLAATRAALFASFSLLEAYFSGLGWVALRRGDVVGRLSANQRRLLEGEKPLRKRALAIPALLVGSPVGASYKERVSALFDVLKPFRDSVAHPSPFAKPEQFGGYDKLAKVYEIDYHLTELVLATTCEVLLAADQHTSGSDALIPGWLQDLEQSRQSAMGPKTLNKTM